ncbi:MAG: YihY/virulence factor BrkB family protein [Proteobacteria bacterium]|nr:YihY/virulence factor BrkB family protein [Pseudomonadota bacterium]
MAHGFVEKLNRVIWGDALYRRGLPGRTVSIVLRYCYAVMRDLMSGQLTLRAMSLVYTTLLSIVPLIALIFSVLKGFGVHEQLEKYMYALLAPLGDKGAEITDNVMQLVHSVNGKVLGGISLAFFIYTAISMVQKVEESFNYVWYVSKPRSFSKRFTEYLFVLFIGPIFIVIALGMITSLQNETLIQYLLKNDILGPLFIATSKLTPYLLVTAVFTFLYAYMPNTQVRIRSALVGGITGGFLWASTSVLFAAFVMNSARTQAIYASFAIAITVLIWLYLNWLILLIGAQLAFYFQNPAYLRIGRREPRLSNSMRERLALNVMFLVGRAFRNPGQIVNVGTLSETIKIPSITLAPVIAGLEKDGLLTSNDSEELLPGREMARIGLNDILAVVRIGGETGSHRDPEWAIEIEGLGRQLDGALLTTVAGRSLSDLLDQADG